MKKLADTLDYLHHTLVVLEAQKPSRGTGVDANLTEQNDYSKMINLKTYFDSLGNKPFFLISSDQTSFNARFFVIIDGQHTDDVHISIHHASAGLTKGYTVGYNYYGWRSKTYQHLDAPTLFTNIVSECRKLIRETADFVNALPP
jgi:hypothetical protein